MESLAKQGWWTEANCKSFCFFFLLATLASQTQPRCIIGGHEVCMWKTGDRRLCLGANPPKKTTPFFSSCFLFLGVGFIHCKMAIPSHGLFGKLPEFYNEKRRVGSTSTETHHLRTHTSPSSQVMDASFRCFKSDQQKKTQIEATVVFHGFRPRCLCFPGDPAVVFVTSYFQFQHLRSSKVTRWQQHNRYNWKVESWGKFHDNKSLSNSQTLFWGFKHPEKWWNTWHPKNNKKTTQNLAKGAPGEISKTSWDCEIFLVDCFSGSLLFLKLRTFKTCLVFVASLVIWPLLNPSFLQGHFCFFLKIHNKYIAP